MEKLSFVIPCYRSEKTINAVVDEIHSVMTVASDYDYEIVLVNDCSPDGVWAVISGICVKDYHVKGINLSEGDYVVSALPVRDEKDDLALFTADGFGKKIAPSDLITQNRGGKGVVCYKGNSYLTAASLVNDTDEILICGDKNSICVSAADIPLLGRATQGNAMVKGNRIISVTKA